MTQTIDQAKLKAAAERLERVLKQYPESEDVQGLLSGLFPLIEDAKAGRINEPVERIPFERNFGEGVYRPYKDPDVEKAYADFATEIEGGRTEEDVQILDYIRAVQESTGRGRP